MMSIDKGLLGQEQLGDVIERHKKYGEFCDCLDIVVLSPRGFEEYEISEKVRAYPTNSCCKLKYCCDAFHVGKKLFKNNGYDLIVTQTPFLDGLAGWCLKKRFGAKLLVHFHGDFWKNRNWLKESRINYVMLLLSKIVVRGADAIRVMSNGQKDKLGRYKNKARIISTPVDLEKYQKCQQYNIETKNILHIGRDDEVKDYNTLVKVFKIIKEKIGDAKFVQVGSDIKIKEAIKENDFQDIETKGRKSADEIIDIYSDSNIFVLSSTSESFGKVLVEANACGRPVVSTATTGAKEIIKDGENGYLVPIGDYQALAEKIIYLLEHPDESKAMGERGRQIVKERFGDNTSKIVKFWQDIICGNL